MDTTVNETWYKDFMREVRTKGKAKGAIFSLKPSASAKIRFITDLKMVLKILIHSRWIQDPAQKAEKSYTVPCLHAYGKEECPFDELDDSKTGNKTGRGSVYHYGFLIYDYTDGQVKLFIYKINRASPMEQVVEHASNYQNTVLGRDFTIKRGPGVGIETTYTATPLDRSEFQFQQDVERDLMGVDLANPRSVHDYEKELLAAAYFPQLLEQGDVKIPPKYLYDEEIKASDLLSDEDDADSLLP